MTILHETEYLIFDLQRHSESGLTMICNVQSKQFGTQLGEIKWYAQWRRYVFEPVTYTTCVFDANCLTDIANFLSTLMEHRKKGKQE